jgi:hypothetical protein
LPASILVVAGLQEDRGCLGEVHDPDEYTTPMSIKSSSLWTMSIPVPTAPPRASAPVSPIKTEAGWPLCRRNPKQAAARGARTAVNWSASAPAVGGICPI